MIKNLFIAIPLLAFLGVVIFLDLPGIQKLFALQNQISQQREIFVQKQLLFAEVEELNEKYEENEEVLLKVNYILPSGKDVPNLIVQFEAMALGAGMVLEAIEFQTGQDTAQSRAAEARTGEEIKVKDYRILGINLSLIGDYVAFKNFVKLVEENIRLMDIVSIGFSQESEEETENPMFHIDVNLNTYYQ